jgi:mannose-6-phosphate isomerase-like protein (cupin superfamily)
MIINQHMKRQSFLKLCLAAGAFVSAPFTSLANLKQNGRIKKGYMVSAGKDRFDKPIAPFAGDRFFGKVSTKDTDGDLFIFESIRAEEGGPILHYHYDQDEWWYVLEGEFLIKVGDITYQAKAGDSVFGPRKIPHAFSKVGKGQGRLLMLYQPAGKMEEYFNKLAAGDFRDMSPGQRDAVRRQHGFENVGPAIGNLKQ